MNRENESTTIELKELYTRFKEILSNRGLDPERIHYNTFARFIYKHSWSNQRKKIL